MMVHVTRSQAMVSIGLTFPAPTYFLHLFPATMSVVFCVGGHLYHVATAGSLWGWVNVRQSNDRLMYP